MKIDSNVNMQINNNTLIPDGSFKVDEKTLKMAKSILSVGQYLSWTKYASFVPGAPSYLSHKAFQVTGDLCSLGLTALEIKFKVDKFLSDATPVDQKVKIGVEIARSLMKLTENGLLDKLPINNFYMKKLNQTLSMIETAIKMDGKMKDLGLHQNSAIAHAKDEIELGMLSLTALKTGLELTGNNGLGSTLVIGGGKGTLVMANGALSAVQMAQQLIQSKA